MINKAISKLVTYALHTGLIEECETVWATNAILQVLKLDSYTDPGVEWGEIDLPAESAALPSRRCSCILIKGERFDVRTKI